VMAYAALNSRNAGSSIIVSRAAIHDHELTEVGNSEQATGNHSDRPGMGTERRLGHENLP
jgi:hypothetical protein